MIAEDAKILSRDNRKRFFSRVSSCMLFYFFFFFPLPLIFLVFLLIQIYIIFSQEVIMDVVSNSLSKKLGIEEITWFFKISFYIFSFLFDVTFLCCLWSSSYIVFDAVSLLLCRWLNEYVYLTLCIIPLLHYISQIYIYIYTVIFWSFWMK